MRLLLILALALVAVADEGFWHPIPRTIYEIQAPSNWKAESKSDQLVLEVPRQGKLVLRVESKLQPGANLEEVARVHLTRWSNRADKYAFQSLEGVGRGKLRGYKVTVLVTEAESAPRPAYSYVFPSLLPGDYLWIWNAEGIENERVDQMVKTLRRRG